MDRFDPVLLWVRVFGTWHVETEDGHTLCVRQIPEDAMRTAYEPIADRCPECDVIRRRLREV